MSREYIWTNSDGLLVGFGTRTDDDQIPSLHAGRDARRTLSCELNLADAPDTFAAANRTAHDAVIPRGSLITAAYLVVITPAVSAGGGTLDIGLWGTNDSVDDADGILDSATVAELNTAGEVHICDGALVAASGNTAAAGVVTVGATANSDCIIAPSRDTAAFEEGLVRLVVEFIPPYPTAVVN